MPAPVNGFKQALRQDAVLYGLWVALASAHGAELCAGAGYDWVLIDGEHGPNDIPLLAAQLAASARQSAHQVVRLAVGEAWLIKQALDIGAQTLLIPMVDTPDQALAAAKACRYPPFGIRGMGAGLGRASDFGRIGDYVATANDQICLIVQIESRLAMANLEAIITTEGVDAVLIGPADLAADLGFPGRADAPEVYAAVEDVLRRAKALGKPAGIMSTDPVMIDLARRSGARFIATQSDVGLLVAAAANHLRSVKGEAGPEATGGY
ncbi:2-keto-3-deoxy-L-rhamnonate aldolase [Agrobacterium vitis]|uniref:HpcH/HpaI aldolase family protein n=1 Tax=Rhizobium/Agrobacterium group TaxID=227290 RepID=UPI0008DC1F0D|nr:MULTISPECIES: HpcH/HpaI aldolase/citrate lyase family protein [Rhizobium/Agrobacterium group]MCF1433724.1 HpcH/HpaI aldolase/citrate lyase family protein [Allorhizobium ampelinum]MUO91814.1 2-keto-3-deoxy-L-rhamnonate aldolase [Agrobacterium vitis]MUZ53881.1 2-keto-3-deoxy-L-rhamnonate aldolase [Agrobacterium vitis]MUZ92993.1 2-keto-3-deoxy-L-rhamnonate aldolase [Agrobacterium vitis]MVA40805.1 2-keto-3-deoxy-L-rhamnonate aldolase [Agrobacterium vitis]